MALCEKCGKSGHDMRDMVADKEKQMFIGPCCIKAQPAVLFQDTEIQFGVEVSSHMGIRAYASYGGLSVEFKKTKEEVQQWLEKTPEETMTPSETPAEPLEKSLN